MVESQTRLSVRRDIDLNKRVFKFVALMRDNLKR